MTGLTAYFGLMDICKPKAGESRSLWSSWSRWNRCRQIAKLQGRVVGIAGTDESKTID
jgi:NADPH-dependent curcumin reductase CurA